MVAGKFIFGFVLSSVTAALAITEELRSGFEEKVREVQVGIVLSTQGGHCSWKLRNAPGTP